MKFLVLLSLVAYCSAVPIGSVYRSGVDYPYGSSTVHDYLRYTYGVHPWLAGNRNIFGSGIYGTGIYDDVLGRGAWGAYRPHHVLGANWPQAYYAGIYGAGIGGVYDDALKTRVLGGYGKTVSGAVPAVVADIKGFSDVSDDDVDTLHHQQLVQEQQLQIQQQLQQQQLQQQQQLLHEEQRLAQRQLFQEEEDMNRRHFVQQEQLKELQERVQKDQLKQKVQLDQVQDLHATYPRYGGSLNRLWGGIRTGLPITGVY